MSFLAILDWYFDSVLIVVVRLCLVSAVSELGYLLYLCLFWLIVSWVCEFVFGWFRLWFVVELLISSVIVLLLFGCFYFSGDWWFGFVFMVSAIFCCLWLNCFTLGFVAYVVGCLGGWLFVLGDIFCFGIIVLF